MSRVALLPLDDRPATYDFPRWLGAAAGLDVAVPPRDWLGNPWRPASTDRLAGWLSETAASADALIVSIDTLAYGGLVAARRSTATAAEAIAGLQPLRDLKRRYPSLRILAFGVLMRVNRSDSAEEEKPYCATYGRRLFRLSYLDHKHSLGETSQAEAAELASIAAEVPIDVVDDYRAGRSRGDAVTRAMVGWLGEGVFDYLLVPQDDTAEYGWNIAEARGLRALIEAEGLTERASVHPGTDEAASLLVAGLACRSAGFAPRVWARYSGIGGPGVRTAYEDRPVEELLKAQLGPLDGTLTAGPSEADLILAVNAPAEGQADAVWQPLLGDRPRIATRDAAARAALKPALRSEGARATRREMETVGRSLDEFVRALAMDVRAGRPVALADLAFVNGADLALGERLLRHVPVAGLAGFAGWNTAGNSLGTVLAQGVIRALSLRAGGSREQLAAHLGFLLLRFVEDVAYQSLVRTELMFVDLPAFGVTPTFERLPDEVRARVIERISHRLRPHAEAWGRLFEGATLPTGPTASATVRRARLSGAYLPWDRLFEVGLSPEIALS